MFRERGAKSAIDRVHTAIHGFLKSACRQAHIPMEKDTSITQCFKLLKNSHPAFQQVEVAHDPDVIKVLGALSTIIDTLNHLRNRASLAHPNETILDEAESHLIIDSAKTFLRYVSARLKTAQDDEVDEINV